jgi:hypothetical protein
MTKLDMYKMEGRLPDTWNRRNTSITDKTIWDDKRGVAIEYGKK